MSIPPAAMAMASLPPAAAAASSSSSTLHSTIDEMQSCLARLRQQPDASHGAYQSATYRLMLRYHTLCGELRRVTAESAARVADPSSAVQYDHLSTMLAAMHAATQMIVPPPPPPSGESMPMDISSEPPVPPMVVESPAAAAIPPPHHKRRRSASSERAAAAAGADEKKQHLDDGDEGVQVSPDREVAAPAAARPLIEVALPFVFAGSTGGEPSKKERHRNERALWARAKGGEERHVCGHHCRPSRPDCLKQTKSGRPVNFEVCRLVPNVGGDAELCVPHYKGYRFNPRDTQSRADVASLYPEQHARLVELDRQLASTVAREVAKHPTDAKLVALGVAVSWFTSDGRMSEEEARDVLVRDSADAGGYWNALLQAQQLFYCQAIQRQRMVQSRGGGSPTPTPTPMAASTEKLATHRWTVVRQARGLQRIARTWWERCTRSPSELRGVRWQGLQVEGTGATAQQCRAGDLPRSESLVSETIERLHALLASLGIDDARRKKCVELKLLRSPPGAARQVLHQDTPDDAVLHAGRRVVPGTKKAPHCVSVILHLNPGTTKGTHMPKCEARDLAALLGSDIACDESQFESADMEQGDAAVFYHDVPHYGPAYPRAKGKGASVKDVSTWRWVLFAMFSPELGDKQDEKQSFVHCG